MGLYEKGRFAFGLYDGTPKFSSNLGLWINKCLWKLVLLQYLSTEMITSNPIYLSTFTKSSAFLSIEREPKI
jgi:hypothetical protein